VLKQRIIPKFLLQDGRLVKGVRFHENHREAGNPVTTAKVYDSYGVDELIFLDIGATLQSRKTMHDVIARASRDIFMPFTAGGGVTSLDDVNRLLRAGADKVAVNTAAVEQPGFISEAARSFGDQCITVSIDYRVMPDGSRRVFTHGGTVDAGLEPIEWARRAQDACCGEILLCSIDRDGTMTGYDLETLQQAVEVLDVPVIASSGAGTLEHCAAALGAGVSAIAIGSLFLFTDHSPIKVRSALFSRGCNVRASLNSRN
jgi:imidazole glycerol-phosphate synthase subunit HisF